MTDMPTKMHKQGYVLKQCTIKNMHSKKQNKKSVSQTGLLDNKVRVQKEKAYSNTVQ
jgi:hypothetical protein